MRAKVAVLGGLLALAAAGCSPEPFDSNAQWRPGGTGAITSYAGGAQPEPTGAAATKPADGDGAQDGENPWAAPPSNPVVQVCYGDLVNAASAVANKAHELCPDGTRSVKRIGTGSFWSGCPLLQPKRATFRCVTETGGKARTG
ncbi:hypothetical protein SAMN05216241_10717 [Limimonas halophila]|uniref:Lipoprotein n=1 Tax=Limimonas halophila TaxID=1082479 RepID=A0A1G7SHV0_9PROT|nr:hypothetical protein [Limimonas halophila]SDG22656.1 hypothetical protein SAMN05216241_10717 [Limimonas halophila]